MPSATPSECSTAAPGKGYPKQKKKQVPDEEVYDFSRKEGPNVQDPRYKGGPCEKTGHVAAPMGRGSPSGKNAWGMWQTCQQCRLRLEYIPAYGAHGRYRSAGPLGADVTATLQEKSNEVAVNPKVLDTTSVALDGAERSLMKRLEKVQKQKEAHQQRTGQVTAGTKKTAKRAQGLTPEELEASSPQTEESWEEVKK